MEKLKWLVAALVAGVLAVVGGTWVYINVIRDEAPERLGSAFEAEPDSAGETGSAGDEAGTDPAGADDSGDDAGTGADPEPAEVLESVEGVWSPTPESLVGYRVGEVLFGQNAEGVGRTSEVTGEVVIVGTTVTEARFEVDMASIESDDSRRDNQFRGRIMDVSTYPTATLVLVEPIELDAIPADLEVISTNASVELTLRGNSQSVPIQVQARLNGTQLEINGAFEIVFEEWGIPNPSTPAITTEDHGELEFLLVLRRSEATS